MSTQGPADTKTESFPGWLSGAAQGYLNAGAQAAQMPYQPYTGPRVADLSPLQQQALGGYGQVAGGVSPLYGTASGTIGTLLQPQNNPYLQNAISAVTTQATDAYNRAVGQTSGRFNTAGNWGSARQAIQDELNQRALATGLGNSIGSIEAGQFNTNNQTALQALSGLNSSLGAATGALGSALTAGAVPQQNLQQVYNTGYNDFLEQRNYPWQQLQRFGGLLGSITGAAPKTTTSVQGYDPVSQGVGLYQLGSQVAKNKGGNSSPDTFNGFTGLDYAGGPAYG